jgi:peptide/nickel transport system substrate-binding protein
MVQLPEQLARWGRIVAAIGLAATLTVTSQPIQRTAAKVAADSGTTFLGTPRSQTLIMDNIDGRIATPGNFNPYLPGVQIGGDGVHALVWSPLWDIDTVKGVQFPDLAAAPIQPLDSTWTKFKITLRQGLTWSDGVPFTAADVLYTANMLLTHPTLPEGAYFKTIVKDVKPIDTYDLELDTFTRQAHIQRIIGSYIWDTGFRIMPAHIWEKHNPLTYDNNPPIGVGPYKLVKYDPNGYWFLWQLRDDWQHSDVGQITGKKPAAKYILVQFYGTEQQRIIATIQHKLDVLMPISPNGWGVMSARDPYAEAWYKNFPYADENDPANRSIFFNDQAYPYNLWQVRWALALAINLPQVTLSYSGILRASVLPIAATDIAEQSVYAPLQSWMTNFTLPDGFKPYDPNFAQEEIALLKQRGYSGLPTDPAQITRIFGPGWFKYAPVEATKLLKSVGFKLSAGTWLLPNGNPWTITVNAPANFEPESGNQGFAIANQWKQFGINSVAQGMDSSTFWTNESEGTYDAGAYWSTGFLSPDASDTLLQFDQKYVVPTGKPAPGDAVRWKNPQASKLLEEMQLNPPEDAKTLQLQQQFFKLFFKDMPLIPMFASTQLVPVDTYYWTNFPTSTNEYNGPWWWWSNFKFILPYLKPTGR